MDKKFFVKYQTARQLREKGYPQKSATMYYDTFSGGEISLITDRECVSCVVEGNDRHPLYNRLSKLYIAAPAYHEVVDWLQEKGIRIEVKVAYQLREKQWSWCGYVYVVEDEDYETSQLADWCSTREGALNKAILKALERL